MLDMAVKEVTKRIPKVRIEPKVLDFESGQLSDIAHDLKKDGAVNVLFLK